MDKHQHLAAWLHIGSGLFTLLFLLAVAGMAGGFLAFVPEVDESAMRLITVFGTVIAALFGVLMVLDLAAGIACLAQWRIGRPLMYLSSALSLLNVPIGTALGLYSLWAYLREPLPARPACPA